MGNMPANQQPGIEHRHQAAGGTPASAQLASPFGGRVAHDPRAEWERTRVHNSPAPQESYSCPSTTSTGAEVSEVRGGTKIKDQRSTGRVRECTTR
jgi:hypothetical protein